LSRRHDGGSNPFEMADSMMSQMMGSMMGGGMLGGGMMGGGMLGGGMGRGGLLGGMDGAMTQMMEGSRNGVGGSGGGSSYSYSSCCVSSSSAGGAAGQPRTVHYSQTSHGMQRRGEEMVSETYRNYTDGTGNEKLGVSRTIGDRGRSIVAERSSDGTERRTDNLRNVNDGSAFDRDWSRHGTVAALNQRREQTSHLMPQLTLAPGPFESAGRYSHGLSERPVQTDGDRAVARQGRIAYEQQRNRMVAEARRQRQGELGNPDRGAGTSQYTQHRQQQVPVPQLGPAGGSSGVHSGAGGTRRYESDARLASRYAEVEARRAGLY